MSHPRCAPRVVRFCVHARKPGHRKVTIVLTRERLWVCVGQIFMVFDYAAGGDLHDVIISSPNKRVPELTARSYVRQLTEGLRHCHSLGVFHRDLKPGQLVA